MKITYNYNYTYTYAYTLILMNLLGLLIIVGLFNDIISVCKFEMITKFSYIILFFVILLLIILLYNISKEKKNKFEILLLSISIITVIITIIFLYLNYKINNSRISEVFVSRFLEFRIIKTQWTISELMLQYDNNDKSKILDLSSIETYNFVKELKTPEQLNEKINNKIIELENEKKQKSWLEMYDNFCDAIFSYDTVKIILIGGTCLLTGLMFCAMLTLLEESAVRNIEISSKFDAMLKLVSDLSRQYRLLTKEFIINCDPNENSIILFVLNRYPHASVTLSETMAIQMQKYSTDLLEGIANGTYPIM